MMTRWIRCQNLGWWYLTRKQTSYLSFELFSASKVLAVYDSSRESFIILGQPRYLWEPGDIVVTSCHYQCIEPFSPPTVLSGTFFSECQYQLISLLDSFFDCGVELQKLVVSVLDEYVFDPAPNRVSVSEGGRLDRTAEGFSLTSYREMTPG